MRLSVVMALLPSTVCIAWGLLWPTVASSQSARLDSSPPALEEVVVTAEKRTSTVQETAISLTALSSADLESRGAVTLASVASEIPGVSQRTSGPGVTEYEMRGLASSGGSSPTVGFYLDEVPLTAPAASQWGKVVIDTDLYDVDRLEVLRGPQGTLYGAGSMGGTIKIYSKPARTDAFDASAALEGSGTHSGGANGRVSGMINIPLATDLAIRVVATATHQSGWIDRVVVNDFPAQPSAAARGDVLAAPVVARHSDVNDSQQESARITATFTPTDHLSIVPTILYQQLRAGGLSTYDSDPGTAAHFQPFDVAEPIRDSTRLASLVVKYGGSAFDTLLSLSYWKRSLRLIQDQSEPDSVLLSTVLGAIPPGSYDPPQGVGPSNIHEDDLLSQFSTEVRLVSSAAGPFKWVAGLFFSDFRNEWDVDSQVPGSVGLFGTANEITWAQPQRIKQTAAFANADYELPAHLKLALGARYFRYTDDLTTTQSGWVTITGSDAVVSAPASAKEHGFDPKVTLSYEPSSDITLFGTVAKGFRPGGGNAPLPLSGPSDCTPFLQQLGLHTAPTFYQSDSVISYELGEKWRVLDRRVTLNASLYHIDWNKVQQLVVLGCGYPFTGNEGKATVDGVEYEGEYLLGHGWRASTSFAYTKAQLAEDVAATGGHRGDPLQDTPKWTAASALMYTFDLSGGQRVTARVGGSYVGSRVDATYALNELPGYFLADARLTLMTGRWSASLFANNITDKRAAINDAASLSFNLQSYNRIATNQPRTIGINFSFQE